MSKYAYCIDDLVINDPSWRLEYRNNILMNTNILMLIHPMYHSPAENSKTMDLFPHIVQTASDKLVEMIKQFAETHPDCPFMVFSNDITTAVNKMQELIAKSHDQLSLDEDWDEFKSFVSDLYGTARIEAITNNPNDPIYS